MRAKLINGRILNLIRSHVEIETPRCFKISDVMDMLPSQADLRSQQSSVDDQGAVGSCSAHALGGALEFLQIKELLIPGSQKQEYGPQFEKVSKLQLYYCERQLEGSVDEDAGVSTLLDACKAAKRFGAAKSSSWPYDPKNLFVKPPKMVYDEAYQHRDKHYYSLHGLIELRRCIYEGFPFLFGIQVYESFMRSKNGSIPLPQYDEQALGGHAVLAVGYDDDKQVFIVKNSWGPNWGDQGYFYLPYEYLHMGLAFDFFTLRLP